MDAERVAKQPTAPVDRIPEVKEMPLEQQLENTFVWMPKAYITTFEDVLRHHFRIQNKMRSELERLHAERAIQILFTMHIAYKTSNGDEL